MQHSPSVTNARHGGSPVPGARRQHQRDIWNLEGRTRTPSGVEMAEMDGVEGAAENRLHTPSALQLRDQTADLDQAFPRRLHLQQALPGLGFQG